MSNASEPSQPCTTVRYGEQLDFSGLTKREHAAILLRVPKSGDDEIDAMIREANRRDAAVAAMQGLLAADDGGNLEYVKAARYASEHANALIAELENQA